MDNIELGKRIKELRKSRHLKQDDLSNILGISRGQISNLEHGRRGLDLPKLLLLCEEFNVNLDFFGIKTDAKQTIEILEKAKLIFSSDQVSDEDKEELYNELMKAYLKFKGTI